MLDVNAVEAVITEALRGKMESYRPEPNNMPFHTRLLGRDRLALYSFIHSLSTSFGTIIFERVALQLAADRFTTAEQQKRVGTEISSGAQAVITEMVTALRAGEAVPNAAEAIRQIRSVAQSGTPVRTRLPKADIYLEENGEITLVELKTAKPNVDGFEKVKQNLLEWIAAIFYQDIDAQSERLCRNPLQSRLPQAICTLDFEGYVGN